MISEKRAYEYHESVLLAETLELLAPREGKVIVDATLGGGGHAEALLATGARVIGLDQDPAAIAFATERLASAGKNFQPVRSSFAKIGEVLDSLSLPTIDGALLDLGVSSHQLDVPERGFSFMREGPLDMRMDPQAPLVARRPVRSRRCSWPSACSSAAASRGAPAATVGRGSDESNPYGQS